MSHPDIERLIQRLTANGVRVLEAEESSPEFVLGVIRENRRRLAREPRTKAMDQVSARLANDLTKDTGLQPGDLARVLLSLSSKLGALAIGHGVPAPMLCQLMAFAADDLDRAARPDVGKAPAGGP